MLFFPHLSWEVFWDLLGKSYWKKEGALLFVLKCISHPPRDSQQWGCWILGLFLSEEHKPESPACLCPNCSKATWQKKTNGSSTRPLPSSGSPRSVLGYLWLLSIWSYYFYVHLKAMWSMFNKQIGINWCLYIWGSYSTQYFPFCWHGLCMSIRREAG